MEKYNFDRQKNNIYILERKEDIRVYVPNILMYMYLDAQLSRYTNY